MHITIFVYGTWGDIRPHIVLGSALQAAGHHVQVVASSAYAPWIRARRLEYSPLTIDMNTYTRENAWVMEESFLRQLQFLRKSMQPIFVQMGQELQLATRHADVLITIELAASLVLPIIQINKLRPIFVNPTNLNPTRQCAFLRPAPDWLPRRGWYNRISYSLIRRTQWSLLAGARKTLAAHLGLPTPAYRDSCNLLDTTPALTIVSPHVFPRPTDWPDHFQVTGYLFDDDPEWTPPADLLRFLDAGPPPVYIGFGSMPDPQPASTTQVICAAVQQTGQRAVLLSGWAGLGNGDLPSSIHVLRYAPHTWLFPRMAAVVHHGGAGTTAAGFRAGIPMVVIPHQGDQSYWGRQTHALGVGTPLIPRRQLTPARLAEAIHTATTDQTMVQKARELGQKIRNEDGTAQAMHWLERFLR